MGRSLHRVDDKLRRKVRREYRAKAKTKYESGRSPRPSFNNDKWKYNIDDYE